MNKLLLAALVAACSSAALAQDADDVEQETKAYKGNVDLGYSAAKANNESESFTFGSKLAYETTNYLNSLELRALNASQEGVTNQERYYAAYQLNRDITETVSAFGRADYDSDRFSGFDYQYQAIAGASVAWSMPENQALKTEFGAGYRYSELRVDNGVPSTNDEEVVYRLAVDYKIQLTDTANFSQTIGSDAGPETIITRSASELSVAISTALALKVGQYYKFFSDPVPGTVSVERETTVSVSYNF